MIGVFIAGTIITLLLVEIFRGDIERE